MIGSPKKIRPPVVRFLFILLTVVTVSGIPPPYDPPDPTCYEGNATSHGCSGALHRVKRQAAGSFKYLYVTQCGIMTTKPANIESIEVKATKEAKDAALEKAARLVFLMMRFMPRTFFTNVAKQGGVGVFAADQVIGDFPEYANTKDKPGCTGKCSGKCRSTCTATDRKYDSLVGYSKANAVVREDNILCEKGDPYNGKLNVLMHEFAHAVHFTALGRSNWHDLLEDAFATRYQIWGTGYATSDMREFFAEATTSYFRTSLLTSQAAEMNVCGDPKDKNICPNEFSSRTNLKTKDPTLFRLVDELYSGSRTFLQGRIGVCDW